MYGQDPMDIQVKNPWIEESRLRKVVCNISVFSSKMRAIVHSPIILISKKMKNYTRTVRCYA